jgi:hypothetical protein
MTMIRILTFEEAIEDSSRYKKRHLLLGNGFSIACRPNIFAYGSLFEQADFSSNPNLPEVFERVGTTDFERVIRVLEGASRIVPIYSSEANDVIAKMATDADALKEILIQTIASNHPRIPNDIPDEQFWACRRFLSHFLGEDNDNGKVYTLNYDLLLYWALMHEDEEGNSIKLATNDGFGRDEDTEPEYVNWMGESGAHGQRVHYLHGALHLFDAGAELQKYTWINTGKPLLEQAREAMQAGKYPLFVAEGESEQKLAKIRHSAYLHHSYKSFAAQMRTRNDALFIYGHSLASNDRHILKKIAKCKIRQIYIGLYGSPGSEANQAIITTAQRLSDQRDEKFPLEVSFFDAQSANVWGTV